jgi:dehydrogenase/reductase SDR family protein 7B
VDAVSSNLQNKVVWITGATSGIGEALAYEYSKSGAVVVLSARREQELERVKQNCSKPENTHILKLDLEQQEAFPLLAQQVHSDLGSIDILINNGGISQRSEAADTSMDIDRKIMEVNYFGNIALTKAVVPFMRKQGSGHIVTTSSISGKFGFFLRSAYSASKHALAGFYESLRLEEEKNNLQVSIVYPGLIATNISVHALDKDGKAHGKMDNKQETGMPADVCAQKIIKGISKGKHEIFVGKGEMKSVLIKRLFPKLFHKLIRKRKPT